MIVRQRLSSEKNTHQDTDFPAREASDTAVSRYQSFLKKLLLGQSEHQFLIDWRLFLIPLVLFLLGQPALQAEAADYNPGLQPVLALLASLLEEIQERPNELQAIANLIETELANKSMGLSIQRYDADGNLEYAFNHNETTPYPVASTAKLFMTLYYFMNEPMETWNAAEGSDVYRMAVYSNNITTGNVLNEVSQYVPGDENPIEKFNSFLHSIGVSQESGLYRWDEGALSGQAITDEQYDPLQSEHPIIRGTSNTPVHNTFTTQDLANGVIFIATAEHDPRWSSDDHFRQAILATRELLSISPPSYQSPIERSFIKIGDSWGKDGYLTPNEIGTYAISDAVVLPRSDGGFLLITFMSMDLTAGDIQPRLGNIINRVNSFEVTREATTFTEHYSNQHNSERLRLNEYNYGYIIPQNVPIYTAPDASAPLIDNAYRTGYTLPNSYLMQGALVRISPIDAEWSKIIIDDPTEIEYGGQTAYLKISDLELLDLEQLSPIEYLDPAQEGGEKLIIVDMSANELVLLEGGKPVLRTPIALNENLTQTGEFLAGRRFLSNNMRGYPGVPFATYFDGPRALHGSPWQRWTDTVTQNNIDRRSSGGCINLPNWPITVPGIGEIRPDELVYRWLGSMTAPQSQISEGWGQNYTAIRVLVVHDQSELPFYHLDQKLAASGITWQSIIDNIEHKSLDAPPSYFESNAGQTDQLDSSVQWESIAVDTVVYARVIKQNPSIYSAPDFAAAQISNPILSTAAPASIFPEERRLLPFNGVLKVVKIDEIWSKLVVDPGVLSPYGDRTQEVFIPTADLWPVPQAEQLFVVEQSLPQDKTAVIIRGEHPELLLVEQSRIVMRVPVFLGGSYDDSTTPPGDYRASRMRESSDMPGFPATGFAAYFENTRGFALHDGYSFDWPDIRQGGYGTAGCVNLPNNSWKTFEFNGQTYSPAEFVYNWLLTDALQYDPTTASESHVSASDPNYFNNTVRVLVIDNIEQLPGFTSGPLTNWNVVLEQYQSITSDTEWILPHSTAN